MRKTFLLIAVFLLSGCVLTKYEKFYLNDRYYNKGEYIILNSNDLENIKTDSMIIYTYNNYCNLPIHCETIFKNFMTKYKIDFISIPFDEFKKTNLAKSISFAPSIIIVHNGEIVDYLKSDSDSDYDKYQNVDEFEKWISKYIYLNKV